MGTYQHHHKLSQRITRLEQRKQVEAVTGRLLRKTKSLFLATKKKLFESLKSENY